ncbi:MAG: hypothetical protein EP329_21065 [Deltaproteobacteria bacterium]|nr:MAG: hypothetical protein EP329_21065 [Deltaproteobacteria bacterium]
MTAPAPPLPPFLRTVAAHGELTLRWTPLVAARAFVVVALREPESFGAAAFWAGEVDNDLIRVPVDARAGEAVVFVPAGRPVALAMVARDAAGALLASPELLAAAQHDCVDHGAEAVQNGHGAVREDDDRRLTGPVPHREPPSQDTPFVFVASEAAPDLDALARRVAESIAQGPSPALPARPRTSCFGARQRWYLTRLALPGTGERHLIRRSTFMDADLIATWSAGPPADAVAVPLDADGLVDGTPGDPDETVFYVLLAGPAPLRPLPLMPVAPPFSSVARPLVLGPAAEQLDAAVAGRIAAITDGPVVLSDLPPVLTLIRAAVAWLSEEHPVRRRAEDAVAALETEPRY